MKELLFNRKTNCSSGRPGLASPGGTHQHLPGGPTGPNLPAAGAARVIRPELPPDQRALLREFEVAPTFDEDNERARERERDAAEAAAGVQRQLELQRP